MPEYTIQDAETGKEIKVNGPNPPTPADMEALFARYYESSPSRLERKSTVGEEAMRGLRTSASGARTGILSALGDEDAQREAALAGIQQSQDIAESYGQAPGFAPVREKYKEEGLAASIGEGVAQIPRAVAQQSGPIASFIGGAKAGAMFMPIPQLKALAGIVGGAAALSPQFLGFNIERQVQEQIDQGVAPENTEIDYELARNAALLQGGIESVGQAIVLGKGLVRSIVGGNKGRTFSATDTNKLIRASERSLLGAAGAGGARGTAAEVPVEVAQQVIERYQAGIEVSSDEAFAEYGEAAFIAATVGGTLGGAGGVSERVGSGLELEAQTRRDAADTTTPEDALTASEQARIDVTNGLNDDQIRAKSRIFKNDLERGEYAKAVVQYRREDRDGTTPTETEAEVETEVETEVVDEAEAGAEVVDEAEAGAEAVVGEAEAGAEAEVVDEAEAEVVDETEAVVDADEAFGVLGSKGFPEETSEEIERGNNAKPVTVRIAEEATKKALDKPNTFDVDVQEGINEVTGNPSETANPLLTQQNLLDSKITKAGREKLKLSVFPENSSDIELSNENLEKQAEALTEYATKGGVSNKQSKIALSLAAGLRTTVKNAKAMADGIIVDETVVDETEVVDTEVVDTEVVDTADDVDVGVVDEEIQKIDQSSISAADTDPDLAAIKAMTYPKTVDVSTATSVSAALNTITNEAVYGSTPKIAAELKASILNNPNISEATKKAARKQFTVARKQLEAIDALYLPTAQVSELSEMVGPDTMEQLQAGNLQGALESVAENGNPDIKRLTRAFLVGLGDTKVVVAPNLRNTSGEVVSGFYRPRTDTIYLNQDRGISQHTLMHETVHAITSHESKKKNSATARQLRTLFDQVVSQLDTTYGATDLDEFIAEAQSNFEFRATLGSITPDGKRISALTRYKNIILNMFRRLMNRPSKNPGSALSAIDKLVVDLMSPAPDRREVGDYFSTSVEQTDEKALQAIGRFGFGKVGKEAIGAWNDNVPTMKSSVRKRLFGFLPLNSIGDYVQKDLPRLSADILDLFKIIQRQAGEKRKYYSKVKTLHSELRQTFKGDREARTLFYNAANFGTRSGVDVDKPRSRYEGYSFNYLLKGKLEEDKHNTARERDKALAIFKGKNPDVDTRTINEDSNKLEAYDYILKNFWNPLGKKKGGQEAYRKLRNAYSVVYEDLIAAVNERMDSIDADASLKKTYRDKLLLDLLNKQRIDPYFPLYRRGTKWLIFQGIDPMTGGVAAYKELYKTDVERQARIRELEGDKQLNQELKGIGQILGITQYDRVDGKDQLPGINSAFAYSILGKVQENTRKAGEEAAAAASKKVLDKGGTQAEASSAAETARNKTRDGAAALEELVFESIVQVSPERSLLRTFKPRENTLGFEEDQIEVLADRMPNFTDQIVKIKYDTQLTAMRDRLADSAISYRDTDKQAYAEDVASIAIEYVTFNQNPNIAQWSKTLKSLGFWWTLGINFASAIVNLSVVPMVVFPYLGGKYGYRNTFSAMSKNLKLLRTTGVYRQEVGFEGATGTQKFDGWSIANPNYEDIDSVPEKLRKYKPLAEKLTDRGLATQSTVADMLDQESASTGAFQKINVGMGYIFHVSERSARHLTAMTVYDLELQQRAKKGPLTDQDRDEAAEIAILETEHTNSGALTETAPRLSQSSLGSLLLMYKRFAFSMIYLQFKMARGIIQKMPEGDRTIATKQLVGVFLSSAFFAGAQGIPLAGMMRTIFNMLKEDDEDDWDTVATSVIGEGWYNGVFYGMGIDVSSRIGMSNLLYRSMPNQENESIITDGIEMLGGPIAGIGMRIGQGVDMMRDGEMMRGTERLLPAGISNMFKARRFGKEGARTLRGDVMVEDLSPASLVGQFLGFAPTEYSRQVEINARNIYQDRLINKRRSKLLKDRNIAIVEGDTDEERKIDEKIIEFNQKHPEYPITSDTKKRSKRTFDNNSMEMDNGVLISSPRRELVRQQTLDLWGTD